MVITPSEAKKCFDENQKEKIDYSLATEIINQIDSFLKKNPTNLIWNYNAKHAVFIKHDHLNKTTLKHIKKLYEEAGWSVGFNWEFKHLTFSPATKQQNHNIYDERPSAHESMRLKSFRNPLCDSDWK